MIDEQWQAVALEVDSHLQRIETELDELRGILRRVGIPVRRQRIRITGQNGAARATLDLLKEEAKRGAAMTPTGVARRLDISPEYAFDLLASLVSTGFVERVARGQYRARISGGAE